MNHEPTAATAPRAAGESRPASLPERYGDLGRIGQGGMGEVRRVRDLHLDRVVAMKILHWGLFEDDDARARFVDEARLAARLQHPGIVPVHDQGQLADGRPWFTMREIEGRTLGQVATEVHAASDPSAWGSTEDGWTLHRLIAALETVCRIAAYAHTEGIAHCDLKPSNIVVGRFGEIQVVDWGIAARIGSTRLGVRGTPTYMAPEQAAGEIGAPVDVYALGAILERLVRGGTPGTDEPPPEPEPLRALASRSMSAGPADRPEALELADALRSWLDGAERRKRAEIELSAARDLSARPASLRARARQLRSRAEQMLEAIPPHAPMELKLDAWDLDEQAAALEAEADVAEEAYTGRLRAALQHVPSLEEAHAGLARHYRSRLELAEAASDRSAMVHARAMLESHDRGWHATWLKGIGALTLVTDPPSQATLFRAVPRHRRLHLERIRELGPTPLVRVSLEPGSYVVRLVRPDRSPVDYPVHIGRCEHWEGIRPGDSDPTPIPLPATLGPHECPVSAGWFLSGGDGEALDGLSRRRLWVDGFVAQRHPVTQAEYLAFVNAIDDLDQAWLPAERESSTGARPLYHPGADGRFELGQTLDGTPLNPRDPVIYVSREAAEAYAHWLSRSTGLPWRLPHDQEWEKAARGVDGRHYPWGDSFDPSFCLMASSHRDVPRWASVDAWPLDRSVYGVQGLGGNVRDWCSNPYTRDGPQDGCRIDPLEGGAGPHMIRGGSWSSAESKCRAAGRFAGGEHQLKSLGFRLVRSLSPPGSR